MRQFDGNPALSSHIVLSTDVRRTLSENGISVADILTRANLDKAEAREVGDPERPSEGAREVVTIILASAAAVAVLTPLITQILQAYARRPVVVEDVELVAISDSKGEVVHDVNGDPVLAWQAKKRLLKTEAQAVRQDTSVEGLGFKISFKQEG